MHKYDRKSVLLAAVDNIVLVSYVPSYSKPQILQFI